MIKKHSIIVVFLLLATALRAQTFTISGVVTDELTGETLIGATVLDVRSGKGAVTNVYGRYSLTLPADSVSLRVAYMGYHTVQETFVLSKNLTYNPKLNTVVELQEIVVTSDRPTSPQSSQMSAVEIPIEHIKAVPVLFGETDILKAIQLLPGVQSGSEGTAGIYVRGGGPDENLFLLDGVPLYNVNHLGGFFSAFNSDAVKNVTLYKGSFPARFGGRLSSVLDVTTNNGNSHEYHMAASIGAIAAKVTVEGPIIKDKTTFSASFRRTYLDALIQPFIKIAAASEGVNMGIGYYFYDLNAKITHRFSDKSHLFATYYMGDDVVYLKYKTRDASMGFMSSDYGEFMNLNYHWGNLVGAIRWNYVLTPKLFMNVTGAFTRYRNNITMGIEEVYNHSGVPNRDEMSMGYRSGIRDITTRVDLDYTPNTSNSFRFGFEELHHIFTPEVMSMKLTSTDTAYADDNIDTTLNQSRIHANELSLYAEDDLVLNEVVKLNLGMRLSGFFVQNRFYPSPQLRLSSRFMLTDDLSVKAGYAFMTQYMHLLSNSNISLPTDLWVPVTNRIPPMKAHQIAAGLFYTLHSLVDLSVEGYYKSMSNLMEYKDGASFWGSSVGWEDKVCMGDGESYGVEFLAQKTVGKFSGWVGYTWSKTTRTFDREGQMLNNGETFPAKYDRRHDISIVAMYKPNDRFDVSATWVYCTGNTATLALQEYSTSTSNADVDYYYDWTNYSVTPYVGQRNNYRMPAYHRLDVSLNFHKKLKKGVRTINISVYNLYNRKNPYLVYKSNRYSTVTSSGTTYGAALVQLSLFPIIPSISYEYKF